MEESAPRPNKGFTTNSHACTRVRRETCQLCIGEECHCSRGCRSSKSGDICCMLQWEAWGQAGGASASRDAAVNLERFGEVSLWQPRDRQKKGEQKENKRARKTKGQGIKKEKQKRNKREKKNLAVANIPSVVNVAVTSSSGLGRKRGSQEFLLLVRQNLNKLLVSVHPVLKSGICQRL